MLKQCLAGVYLGEQRPLCTSLLPRGQWGWAEWLPAAGQGGGAVRVVRALPGPSHAPGQEMRRSRAFALVSKCCHHCLCGLRLGTGLNNTSRVSCQSPRPAPHGGRGVGSPWGPSCRREVRCRPACAVLPLSVALLCVAPAAVGGLFLPCMVSVGLFSSIAAVLNMWLWTGSSPWSPASWSSVLSQVRADPYGARHVADQPKGRA